MLLRDFEPYAKVFMNTNVVITVTMVILLRDFGPYGTIFMTVFITIVHLPVILNGLFTNKEVITDYSHPSLVPRSRTSRSYTSSPSQAPPWCTVGLL
jgi:hypothetical protein